ncbi:MAG: penicillin-binding protein 2 [Alphaproteobacteria bacterium]
MMNDKGKVLLVRSLFLLGGMLLLLLMLIFRLYYLQIYQADKYTVMSDDNRITTRILVPSRGIVYDKNGVVLANNVQNFKAFILPEQAHDVDNILSKFSEIVPLDEDEILKIKKEIKRSRSFMLVKVKEKLDWEQVSSILLNITDMPGIIIDEGLSRHYPYSEKTSHLLGYVASVSDKDVKDSPLLDVPDFKIGKSGIEKMFEKQLRGKGGNLKSEVNAIGRIMQDIEKVEAIKGQDITLTIDARLQEKAFDYLGEESGAVVLLDINTGEILAFVSTPAYDSNKMAQGISTVDWNNLLNNEKKPLTNKIISGQYSPGSTFKMITAIAGLEAKAISRTTKVGCSGAMPLGNHIFHCWKKGGHGFLDVVGALQHSCDVFFYELSLKIGIDKIAEVAGRFGLGSSTNLGFDNEKVGLIPSTSWKLERFSESWQGGESVIAGIGQGYLLTTPMQLVLMTARMVNGGYYVNPSFVKITGEEKQQIKRMPVSDEHLQIVKDGMFAVVNEKGGTAFWSRFNLNGEKMAGKTGTTQVKRISMKERETGVLKTEQLPWKFRNHALFVGFAPYDNPKYAVAVIVEHGGSGSTVAAPIASKILKDALIIDKEEEN